MGRLRPRLLRLEHDAGARGPFSETAPLTHEQRSERVHYWLGQDPVMLSDFDRQRVTTIRYVLDRAQKRMDAQA